MMVAPVLMHALGVKLCYLDCAGSAVRSCCLKVIVTITVIANLVHYMAWLRNLLRN
jgi:hypothetical protein